MVRPDWRLGDRLIGRGNNQNQAMFLRWATERDGPGWEKEFWLLYLRTDIEMYVGTMTIWVIGIDKWEKAP